MPAVFCRHRAATRTRAHARGPAGPAAARPALSEPRRPSRLSAAERSALNRRKIGHLEVTRDDGVDRRRDSFAGWKLRYAALPEIALDEVSTGTTFAGRPLAAPLIISCMTGGVGEPFRTLNRNLALGAEALGIPVGLGSMKVMLSHAEAGESYRVRHLAPNVPLIANLGLVSFNYGVRLKHLERLIEAVEPDVFGIHLNALQEVVQEGGDTDFRGLLDVLGEVCAHSRLPVYVKECGGGIAPHLVRAIAGRGAAFVDVSGNDGTSWAAVEARLSREPDFGELFADFGLPTAWILARLAPEERGPARVVASGGIRNGLQAVKALALGADYVAMARPFIQAAHESPEAVVALGERVIREMRTAMFLVGARRLSDLDPSLFVEP